jgi:hypothetical protein
VSLTVQVDEYAQGRVITLAPGLVILLADSPGRYIASKELEQVCGKCGEKLRTWSMWRTTPENPQVVYVACECLVMAIEGERFSVSEVTRHGKASAGWLRVS